jgi:hypothetical protein
VLYPGHIDCDRCKKLVTDDDEFCRNNTQHHSCRECGECITESAPRVLGMASDIDVHTHCAKCVRCNDIGLYGCGSYGDYERSFVSKDGQLMHNDCIECNKCGISRRGVYVYAVGDAFEHFVCPRTPLVLWNRPTMRSRLVSDESI